MESLCVAATCFSLGAGIAKASMALTHFVRDARDAAEDIDAVSKELQALATILTPLAQISQSKSTTVPHIYLQQIESVMLDCAGVVEQIGEVVKKHQVNGVLTTTSWVMFGKTDVQKLRESLEAYKMALSLGMHAISM